MAVERRVASSQRPAPRGGSTRSATTAPSRPCATAADATPVVAQAKAASPLTQRVRVTTRSERYALVAASGIPRIITSATTRPAGDAGLGTSGRWSTSQAGTASSAGSGPTGAGPPRPGPDQPSVHDDQSTAASARLPTSSPPARPDPAPVRTPGPSVRAAATATSPAAAVASTPGWRTSWPSQERGVRSCLVTDRGPGGHERVVDRVAPAGEHGAAGGEQHGEVAAPDLAAVARAPPGSGAAEGVERGERGELGPRGPRALEQDHPHGRDDRGDGDPQGQGRRRPPGRPREGDAAGRAAARRARGDCDGDAGCGAHPHRGHDDDPPARVVGAPAQVEVGADVAEGGLPAAQGDDEVALDEGAGERDRQRVGHPVVLPLVGLAGHRSGEEAAAARAADLERPQEVRVGRVDVLGADDAGRR